jgi:hypothetical protein
MRMWMGQLAGMSQSVSRCKAYTSSWSLLGGEARVKQEDTRHQHPRRIANRLIGWTQADTNHTANGLPHTLRERSEQAEHKRVKVTAFAAKRCMNGRRS